VGWGGMALVGMQLLLLEHVSSMKLLLLKKKSGFRHAVDNRWSHFLGTTTVVNRF
jgi:hypothetical protein